MIDRIPELRRGIHSVPERPLSSEPVIDLGDKIIVVIGIQHGRPSGFGQIQAEQDIADFERRFGEIGAFSIDSQPNPTIDGSQIDPQNGVSDYPDLINWGILTAMHRGIPLIGADPTNLLGNGGNISLSLLEDDGFKNAAKPEVINQKYPEIIQRFPEGTETEKLIKTTHQISQIRDRELQLDYGLAGLDATVVFGLLTYAGLSLSHNKFSRRTFLKMGSTAGIAALLNLVASAEKRKMEGSLHILRRSSQQLETDIKAVSGVTQFHQDDDAVFNKLNTSGEITHEFYQSGSFNRLAEFTSEMEKYLIVFRNALIAEVLASPARDLVGNDVPLPLKIADVMGLLHVEVPKQYRISSMLQDSTGRRNTIKTLLASFSQGAREIGIKVDMDKFFSDLKAYPKTFLIGKDGSITAKPIKIDALERIINEVQHKT